MNPSVTVIIPTTGADTLYQCVKSVLTQTYINVKPYIVFDGIYSAKPEPLWDLEEELDMEFGDIDYTVLPYNVGANGWYGHRIFAAFSYLVNTDYVCFLDQDNWLEPNHIEDLVKCLEDGGNWAFSFRNIVSKEGKFICRDDCESLGFYTQGKFTPQHIDTSCFFVKREALVKVAHAWYGQWGADRQFYQNLNHYFPNCKASNKYSVNYRLGGNPGSPTEEMFIQNNKLVRDYYLETGLTELPWNNTK